MLSLPVGGESQAKRPLGSCLHGSMPLLDANGVWPGMRPKRCVAPLPPASGYHGCLVLHLLHQLQDPSLDIRIGQGHSPSGHFVKFFFPSTSSHICDQHHFPYGLLSKTPLFSRVFLYAYVLWIVHFIPMQLGHRMPRHLVKYFGDGTHPRSC